MIKHLSKKEVREIEAEIESKEPAEMKVAVVMRYYEKIPKGLFGHFMRVAIRTFKYDWRKDGTKTLL